MTRPLHRWQVRQALIDKLVATLIDCSDLADKLRTVDQYDPHDPKAAALKPDAEILASLDAMETE